VDDHLHIFDFDYTLYRTSESVVVWSPRGSLNVNGKTGIRITPEEFHSYIPGSDEIINDSSFFEFDSINWELAYPINPVLDIFNARKNKLILTARKQRVEPHIRKRFDESIEFIGLGSGAVESKIKKINSLKKKYGKICIYEDNYKLVDYYEKQGVPCVYVTSKINECVLKFFNY
jgi:hypothetical protein